MFSIDFSKNEPMIFVSAVQTYFFLQDLINLKLSDFVI